MLDIGSHTVVVRASAQDVSTYSNNDDIILTVIQSDYE